MFAAEEKSSDADLQQAGLLMSEVDIFKLAGRSSPPFSLASCLAASLALQRLTKSSLHLEGATCSIRACIRFLIIL